MLISKRRFQFRKPLRTLAFDGLRELPCQISRRGPPTRTEWKDVNLGKAYFATSGKRLLEFLFGLTRKSHDHVCRKCGLIKPLGGEMAAVNEAATPPPTSHSAEH